MKRTHPVRTSQVQPEETLADAAVNHGHAESNPTAIGTVANENALIEQDLVKIKEDRLKAIQALPKSVWG